MTGTPITSSLAATTVTITITTTGCLEWSFFRFVTMYILMYAMVNSFANVYNNVNQFYMAGLMAAPMAMIELVLMSSMYKNKRLNALIGAGSLAALVVFFLLIRAQTAVTDGQFLRSMIPHHAGAILMCEKSPAQAAQI